MVLTGAQLTGKPSSWQKVKPSITDYGISFSVVTLNLLGFCVQVY